MKRFVKAQRAMTCCYPVWCIGVVLFLPVMVVIFIVTTAASALAEAWREVAEGVVDMYEVVGGNIFSRKRYEASRRRCRPRNMGRED